MLPVLWLLLLIVLSVNFVAFGLEPNFLYPLKNVTILQGRDAIFTCVIDNLGEYRVAWIKADTKAILAIHEHIISNNARLSVTHNDFNTWTLNIRGVQWEDRGPYLCQVNTEPIKSQTAFLEVVIPPDIINDETSMVVKVPEGGTAKLVCNVTGFPKPKVVWKREDRVDIVLRYPDTTVQFVSTVEGEVLTLSKVTRFEMGAYLCIASNGVPPSLSMRMMLHVNFHPLIHVPNQIMEAPPNTDVFLQCQVEAFPKAKNYWTKESGEMIISNDKYLISEEASTYYSSTMRLVIVSFQHEDIGGYKCISKNSIGDAEGNIRLYDVEMPNRAKSDNEEANELSVQGQQGPLREGAIAVASGRLSASPEVHDSSSSSCSPQIFIVLVIFLQLPNTFLELLQEFYE